MGEKGAVFYVTPEVHDDPSMPPAWAVVGTVDEAVRRHITDLLREAYSQNVPGRPAEIAAREMMRLMEEDAVEQDVMGTGMTFLYHTLAAHNLAWQKAGIDPAMGDAIALIRDSEEPGEPTP